MTKEEMLIKINSIDAIAGNLQADTTSIIYFLERNELKLELLEGKTKKLLEHAEECGIDLIRLSEIKDEEEGMK